MKSKKILVVRHGAYGDVTIITPVIRKLKQDGWDVVVNCTERGEAVLTGNPNVSELLVDSMDKTHINDLKDYIKDLQKKIGAERLIDFTETIETVLAFGPRNPQYVYTKDERRELANKNYYEYAFEHAGYKEQEDYTPELFFTEGEHEAARASLTEGQFNIMWCLSGSGSNKAWPHTHETWKELLKNPDINIITVGDDKCAGLETLDHPRILKLSGKIAMRYTMCLTGHVDLVVSPDTGVLHASGCYDTPKIGLLGHTNIENITKHFKNDYSMESDADCAPCFRIIYNADVQCPRDPESLACWCMYKLKKKQISNQVMKVYDKWKKKEKEPKLNAQYAAA